MIFSGVIIILWPISEVLKKFIQSLCSGYYFNWLLFIHSSDSQNSPQRTGTIVPVLQMRKVGAPWGPELAQGHSEWIAEPSGPWSCSQIPRTVVFDFFYLFHLGWKQRAPYHRVSLLVGRTVKATKRGDGGEKAGRCHGFNVFPWSSCVARIIILQRTPYLSNSHHGVNLSGLLPDSTTWLWTSGIRNSLQSSFLYKSLISGVLLQQQDTN